MQHTPDDIGFLFMQLLRKRLVLTARTSMRKNASLGKLYGDMQEAYQRMQTPLIHEQEPSFRVRLLLFLVQFPFLGS